MKSSDTIQPALQGAVALFNRDYEKQSTIQPALQGAVTLFAGTFREAPMLTR